MPIDGVFPSKINISTPKLTAAERVNRNLRLSIERFPSDKKLIFYQKAGFDAATNGGVGASMSRLVVEEYFNLFVS
ncbi:MAG: hypothetical protein Kow00117_01050 [Phototrophicales bacterium]